MIHFNKPLLCGNEEKYVLKALRSNKISGDGFFTKKCEKWFENKLNCKKALLTTSCTHALEMAAILLEIKEGDEVIMPSYTFVSTANAFVLRGAKIIFVDINPDTMNIDESKIQSAISEKTKVIVPVHYAGVPCEMDTIMKIAEKYSLFVVEDAAQAMMSKYKSRDLGTIGHLGTYSFHETKNYTSAGEGGLLIINDDKLRQRAEIIREKGTNRARFFRGEVDKYSWVDMGSSYLISDVSAAYLWGQLKKAVEINSKRLKIWHRYYKKLKALEKKSFLRLPKIDSKIKHNGHIFYIKVKNVEEREKLIEYLKRNKINATFHYVPLHSSFAGLKYGKFVGEDKFTTKQSEVLIRLPLYNSLKKSEQSYIINKIENFYKREIDDGSR